VRRVLQTNYSTECSCTRSPEHFTLQGYDSGLDVLLSTDHEHKVAKQTLFSVNESQANLVEGSAKNSTTGPSLSYVIKLAKGAMISFFAIHNYPKDASEVIVDQILGCVAVGTTMSGLTHRRAVDKKLPPKSQSSSSSTTQSKTSGDDQIVTHTIEYGCNCVSGNFGKVKLSYTLKIEKGHAKEEMKFRATAALEQAATKQPLKITDKGATENKEDNTAKIKNPSQSTTTTTSPAGPPPGAINSPPQVIGALNVEEWDSD